MPNPLIEFIAELAAEGLHPSVIAVESIDGAWQARVEFDDWCGLGDGGSETAVTIDRSNMPTGVKVFGRERFAARTMPLELPCRDSVDAWMREVATVGRAPDVAWVTPLHCVAKPIEWLREPLRSALLRQQQ